MVNPQSQALISFPVLVDLGDASGPPSPVESHWLSFACQLIETKLLQKLRFQFGEVRAALLSDVQALVDYHLEETHVHVCKRGLAKGKRSASLRMSDTCAPVLVCALEVLHVGMQELLHACDTSRTAAEVIGFFLKIDHLGPFLGNFKA